MEGKIPQTLQEAARSITELRKQLEDHNYSYYVLDQPVIDDAQFDALTLLSLTCHNKLDSKEMEDYRYGLKKAS